MLRTKMFQDMKEHKLQFISIFLMAFIGVYIFAGIGGEWAGVNHYREHYYEETNLADGWIWGEGFTDDDLKKVENIDGIDSVEKRCYLQVTGKDSYAPTVYFYGLDKNEICKPYVVEGEDFDPSATGKMWVDQKFAEKKNLKVGDSYTFSFDSTDFTLKVAGLVYSSEYQYYCNDTDMWPDYNKVGFVYAPVSSIPIKDYIINYIQNSNKSVSELVDQFANENDEIAKNRKMLDGLSKDFIVKQLKKADVSEFNEMVPYTQIIFKSSVDASTLNDKIDSVLKGRYAAYSTRAETSGIVMLDSEMEQHKMLGSIFPVVFVAIAVLAIITCMNRLINNQRVQIGTLKALGFSKGRIIWHYVNYGLWLSLAGAVLGAVVGPLTLPYLFYGTMKSYYSLPKWTPGFDISFLYVILITVAACTLATLFSALGLLGGTPAEALRPKPPKSYKLTPLERSKNWKKLNFNFRWSWRSTIRGRAKTLMGILGTLSCMALLIGSMSCYDSITDLEKWNYNEIETQQTRLVLDSDIKIKDAEKIKDDIDGELIMSNAIEIKANNVRKTSQATITDGSGTYFITDTKRQQVTPTDDTFAVTKKVADSLGIKEGDKVDWHIYTSDKWTTSTVTLVCRNPMTQGIVITQNTLEKAGYDFKPNYADTKKVLKDYNKKGVANLMTSEEMHNFMANYMESMNMMVGILIFMAILMAVVVLHNLGQLTFTERQRENATLKVLGFSTTKIMKSTLYQNLMFAVIGVILGAPAGMWLVQIMIDSAGESFDMMAKLSVPSFIFSMAMTIGVSALVSLMMNKKIRKLNMVESLKGVE